MFLNKSMFWVLKGGQRCDEVKAIINPQKKDWGQPRSK